MLKAKDFRNMSVDELESAHLTHRKALYDLRCEQKKAGANEKPHRPAQTRKEIARILTVLTEKKSV